MAMLLENQTSLRAAIDELRNAIIRCMGEEHESTGVIAQIECTVTDIEHKAQVVSAKLEHTNGADNFVAVPTPSFSPL
jgi:hypothetical protein